MIGDLSKADKIDFSNKTVAYIVEDTDAGRSCVTACEEALEKFCGGSTTVAVEVVTQGTTDFYSQISKLKSLDPDVVMTFFVPLNSGVAYTKQAYENSVDWLDVAFVYPLKAGFVEQTVQPLKAFCGCRCRLTTGTTLTVQRLQRESTRCSPMPH